MSASQSRLYSVLVKTAERLRLEADAVLLEAAGITTAQGAVIAVIASDPDATQSDIAQAMDLSEPAVTQMINRLQREGLIERSRDSVDRRRWRLTITALGEARAAKAQEAFIPINALLDEVLGVDQIAKLTAQLNDVRAALKAKDKDAG